MANNQILASDNFASGSLNANWAALTGFGESQIVSGSPNVAEPPALATWGGQIWSVAFPNDHICELTLGALTQEVNTFLQMFVRWTNASFTGYGLSLTNGTAQLYRYDSSSSSTQLGSTTSGLTFTAGDVWTFEAAGSVLTAYQNGKYVISFYDPTYTSGSMGWRQIVASGTNVNHSQVRAWRGYSAVQQDGIWQKQGIVLPAIAADLGAATPGQGIQAWSAIYENVNVQFLSGFVYKTWLNSNWGALTGGNVYYAESSDGETWVRSASPVAAGYTNASVFKNGSTYYMYAQTTAGNGNGTMQVLTSPDGVTWTLQSPTSTIGPGGAGAWDHGYFYNIITIIIVAGTWYGFYNGGVNGSGQFSTGLATSTDGINWTKYSGTGGPVIPAAVTGGPLRLVNGTYYMWCIQNQLGQGSSGLDPFDMVRFSSANLTTWALSAHSAHHTQFFEAVNRITGGLTPAFSFNINGKAYMYTNSSPGDSTPPQMGQIGLMIGPSTLEQISALPEDAVSPLASDAFTSGSGNLSANWSTPTGSTKLQIVSGNLVEATVLSSTCAMYNTAAVYGANQYAEITIATLDSSNYVEPLVRVQPGSVSWYGMSLVGPTGTADTEVSIAVINAGAQTIISPTIQVTPQIGDVFRLSVVNGSDGFPVLSLFQNGFVILQAQDYSAAFSSGFPGMAIYATTALANTQISLFAAGNANVIPAYTSSGGQGNQPAGNVIFDLDGDGYPIAELQTGTDA